MECIGQPECFFSKIGKIRMTHHRDSIGYSSSGSNQYLVSIYRKLATSPCQGTYSVYSKIELWCCVQQEGLFHGCPAVPWELEVNLYSLKLKFLYYISPFQSNVKYQKDREHLEEMSNHIFATSIMEHTLETNAKQKPFSSKISFTTGGKWFLPRVSFASQSR